MPNNNSKKSQNKAEGKRSTLSAVPPVTEETPEEAPKEQGDTAEQPQPKYITLEVFEQDGKLMTRHEYAGFNLLEVIAVLDNTKMALQHQLIGATKPVSDTPRN
jgi:hypothetical protein